MTATMVTPRNAHDTGSSWHMLHMTQAPLLTLPLCLDDSHHGHSLDCSSWQRRRLLTLSLCRRSNVPIPCQHSHMGLFYFSSCENKLRTSFLCSPAPTVTPPLTRVINETSCVKTNRTYNFCFQKFVSACMCVTSTSWIGPSQSLDRWQTGLWQILLVIYVLCEKWEA